MTKFLKSILKKDKTFEPLTQDNTRYTQIILGKKYFHKKY